MKIGLDLHGVIDACPQFFAELTHLFVEAGHEIHVITGPPINDKLRAELEACGIVWTHLFSIVDKLKESQVKMWQDDKGHWWADAYDWDRVKGAYCHEQGIDLHFDDSDTYRYFFKTPFARFFSRDTQRINKTKVPHGTSPTRLYRTSSDADSESVL